LHAGDARRLGAASAWTHSASARAARRADIALVTIGRAFARAGLVARDGPCLIATVQKRGRLSEIFVVVRSA
jgi:hypothetical protein